MRNCKGLTWSENKTKRWEFETFLANQNKNEKPLEVPLHLEVCFFMPLPRQYAPHKLYHFQKPALNDLIAGLLFIAENIVFKPDCLIVSITAKKVHDSIPRTEFIFTKVQ